MLGINVALLCTCRTLYPTMRGFLLISLQAQQSLSEMRFSFGVSQSAFTANAICTRSDSGQVVYLTHYPRVLDFFFFFPIPGMIDKKRTLEFSAVDNHNNNMTMFARPAESYQARYHNHSRLPACAIGARCWRKGCLSVGYLERAWADPMNDRWIISIISGWCWWWTSIIALDLLKIQHHNLGSYDSVSLLASGAVAIN